MMLRPRFAPVAFGAVVSTTATNSGCCVRSVGHIAREHFAKTVGRSGEIDRG